MVIIKLTLCEILVKTSRNMHPQMSQVGPLKWREPVYLSDGNPEEHWRCYALA